MHWAAWLISMTVFAQTPVTTAQYDNARTGANLHESVLTPRNVNPAKFGKLFVMPVDGDVYAQPLYVPQLEIPGKGSHDVVFVATEQNSVYAFDATHEGQALWHVNFLNTARGVATVRWNQVGCSFLGEDIGITSTPVIDAASRTLYLVVRTAEQSGGQTLFYQRLHALDITTGAERPASPVLIRAVSRGASSWFGWFSSDVHFHALMENPRAAMLLSNGTVWIAWGSACDAGTYYGWVLGYDGQTLKQTGAFNAAPDRNQSGIWQSDTGIAADEEGDVYAITGNGKFTLPSGGRDYGDSVIRLHAENGTVAVRDFFTPSDEAELNRTDADLGSGGPVLLPGRLMVAAGKSATIYLLDRDRMGKFRPGADGHALQAVHGLAGGVYGAPAYWNGHLYFFAQNDVLKDFAFVNGRLSTGPVHAGKVDFGSPGAIPSVSANGMKDGIVWIVLTKGHRERQRESVLQAYDAADVSKLLFTTDGRNSPGQALRFTIPVVANGRVYVAGRNVVAVYGLKQSDIPATAR